MLPYKQYREGSASMPTDVKKIKTQEDSAPDDYLEYAAQDLHDAFKAGDVKAIAAALRAAFEILDSEPHHEGPHE